VYIRNGFIMEMASLLFPPFGAHAVAGPDMDGNDWYDERRKLLDKQKAVLGEPILLGGHSSCEIVSNVGNHMYLVSGADVGPDIPLEYGPSWKSWSAPHYMAMISNLETKAAAEQQVTEMRRLGLMQPLLGPAESFRYNPGNWSIAAIHTKAVSINAFFNTLGYYHGLCALEGYEDGVYRAVSQDSNLRDAVKAVSGLCAYFISPTNSGVASSGGTGSVSVTCGSDCSWTATSNAAWITITAGASGSGNGTVRYSVTSDNSGVVRTGTVTIAGQTFTITQGLLLYTDYGPAGTWMYNGSTWTKITPANPQSMVASDSRFYADYGSSGIWMYDGSTWTKIAAGDPEGLAAAGSLLYADYGSSGTWMYNGSKWTKITPADPQGLAASGTMLYADYGSSGTWMYDGNTWAKITSVDAESITVP